METSNDIENPAATPPPCGSDRTKTPAPPYDFDKLLSELDFLEIKNRVENLEFFEFKKTDKSRKFTVSIGARFCDNGRWKDNCVCNVSCMHNLGGFGSPYEREEFLRLDFEKVLDRFARCLGVSRHTGARQLSLFVEYEHAAKTAA